MSSYALLARLSNVEGSADDLEASIASLSASKQDNIQNATVMEGQAVLNGTRLNKIGTKDNTLTAETVNQIIQLGVDKSVIQEKLTPGQVLANDNSGSILSGNKIKGLKGDRGITLSGDSEKLVLTGPLTAENGLSVTTVTTPTLNVNTIDSVADHSTPFATTYPDLKMKQNVQIGSFEEHQIGNLKNLKVYGNATLNGNTTIH